MLMRRSRQKDFNMKDTMKHAEKHKVAAVKR